MVSIIICIRWFCTIVGEKKLLNSPFHSESKRKFYCFSSNVFQVSSTVLTKTKTKANINDPIISDEKTF